MSNLVCDLCGEKVHEVTQHLGYWGCEKCVKRHEITTFTERGFEKLKAAQLRVNSDSATPRDYDGGCMCDCDGCQDCDLVG